MKKHNKALICAFAAALTAAAALPAAAMAAETDDIAAVSSEKAEILTGDFNDSKALGWVIDRKGCLYYRDKDGKVLTGEHEVDGVPYLFSKNGVLKTGWRTVAGKRRYYDPETGKLRKGWVDYCNKQFYIDEDGAKLHDTVFDEDGKRYFMSDTGAVPAPGTFVHFEDNSYCVGEDGSLLSGVVEINYVPYVFDKNCVQQTGWVTPDNKRWYHFDPMLGTPDLGWFSDGDGTYYISTEYGRAVGDTTIDGIGYFFEDDGKLRSGWIDDNGKTRYICGDGTFLRGLSDIDGQSYLFNEDGVLCHGLCTVNGKLYLCDEEGKPESGMVSAGEAAYFFGSGYAAEKGIIQIDDKKYLFGEDYKMAKGITTWMGKTYYFDEKEGFMRTGRLRINDKKYYFAEDGAMHKGWLDLGENRYYFGEDGVMASGLLEIDGKVYFFNLESGAMSTGRIKINDDKYLFDADGTMHHGWAELSDGKYYFGEDGKMRIGWIEVDGDKYYLDPSTGKMVTNRVVNDLNLTSEGKAVGLSAVQKRAKSALDTSGRTLQGIYNYVRNNNKYKLTESTKSLQQIESIGWAYFANYAFDNRFVVCYYFAAIMDLLYQQAGYTTRIVYGTGRYTSDHYWNQVLVDGKWLNYDACNGFCGVTDEVLKKENYTWYQYVYAKFY